MQDVLEHAQGSGKPHAIGHDAARVVFARHPCDALHQLRELVQLLRVFRPRVVRAVLSRGEQPER